MLRAAPRLEPFGTRFSGIFGRRNDRDRRRQWCRPDPPHGRTRCCCRSRRPATSRPSPAILQPAEPFLDLSGEDIRKSLYLTTDASGEELCLRPDLTIPVARDYLASGARRPAGGLQLSRAGVPLSRRPAERIPAGRHRILRPAGPRRGRCRNAGAGAGSDRGVRLDAMSKSAPATSRCSLR